MNLENCGYVSDWQCTPPLTAHQNNALNVLPTAKNSRTVINSSVEYSSVAVLLRAFKGKPKAMLSVAGYFTSGSESKNS